MKIKADQILYFLLVVFTLSYVSACSSLKSQNDKKMTDEEYYLYLREDTTFCEIPELNVKREFFEILDTVIFANDSLYKCSSDPNPYFFYIEVRNQNENLIYKIQTEYSTIHLEYYCLGGFAYKNELFVVNKNSEPTPYFCIEENTKQIKIPFRYRIHQPDFYFVAKIENENIDFECIKPEVYKVK